MVYRDDDRYQPITAPRSRRRQMWACGKCDWRKSWLWKPACPAHGKGPVRQVGGRR